MKKVKLHNFYESIGVLERIIVIVAAIFAAWPLYEFLDEKEDRELDRISNFVLAYSTCFDPATGRKRFADPDAWLAIKDQISELEEELLILAEGLPETEQKRLSDAPLNFELRKHGLPLNGLSEGFRLKYVQASRINSELAKLRDDEKAKRLPTTIHKHCEELQRINIDFNILAAESS